MIEWNLWDKCQETRKPKKWYVLYLSNAFATSPKLNGADQRGIKETFLQALFDDYTSINSIFVYDH